MLKLKKAFAKFSKMMLLFGIFSGTRLYFQLWFKRLNKIKLPHVRYPFKLRADTSDVPTFQQVFVEGEYKIGFRTPPQRIIDAGANVGLFAIKMKNDFPDASIVCIEPDTDNFQIATQNLMPYSKIFLENAGLWSKDTKLKISDKFNLGKWAMVVEEDIQNGNIQTVSIPYLMQKYQWDYIDVLKMDIESSEKQLFSENYEMWLPKVKVLIIELHDWMEKGCSRTFFEAINKTIPRYTYSVMGENTIIVNDDL